MFTPKLKKDNLIRPTVPHILLNSIPSADTKFSACEGTNFASCDKQLSPTTHIHLLQQLAFHDTYSPLTTICFLRSHPPFMAQTCLSWHKSAFHGANSLFMAHIRHLWYIIASYCTYLPPTTPYSLSRHKPISDGGTTPYSPSTTQTRL